MHLPPELKRSLLRSVAFLALGLAVVAASFSGRASQAAPLQQDTDTVTPSVTHTASPTLSATPTGSLTPSASVSPGASVSPSATATVTGTPPTPTSTSVATATPLPTTTLAPTQTLPPTLPVFTPALPPAATPGLLLSPVPLETLPSATPAPPTATLKPFPLVTYQYPQRTPTHPLLARQGASSGDDPPKNDGFSVRRAWAALIRSAPWLLLGALWVGLGAWFVASQILLHRNK